VESFYNRLRRHSTLVNAGIKWDASSGFAGIKLVHVEQRRPLCVDGRDDKHPLSSGLDI
jgi:hypothetical protein